MQAPNRNSVNLADLFSLFSETLRIAMGEPVRSGVTLASLFSELQGEHFPNRREFEVAVLEIFNRHVLDLPIGYSYKDAIDGALAHGWLITNAGRNGVSVDLGKDQPNR